MENAALAAKLEAFAALLELNGAGYYTSRAYQRAAELIRDTRAPVAELVREGRVRELRGIGPGIEARLLELVETGDLAELRELEETLMPELVGLGHLLGVGPKRMRELAEALGVRTTDEFRAAVEEGRLGSVPGVGPKTEAKLRAGLARAAKPKPRRALLLNRAWALSHGVAGPLAGEVTGDPRRWRDACEDFAVVVSANTPGGVIDAFAELPEIVSLVERDERRALGVTVEGVPVELVVPRPESFGTALVRATGSVPYVAALEPLPEAADEEGVYAALEVPWCPPELRERPHREEPPPSLLRLDDVRGDLHIHTTWSDGKASVLEMASAALYRGYEYLAICDHTVSVRVVPGLDADAVRRQGEEVAEANERLAPFRVLGGIECDILADGRLDLPDDVLAELDWVQLSLHAGQRGLRKDLTRKVTEAMRHPAVRCLSHPTGRLINHRPPNALDLERAFQVALEEGVAIEVNGLPDRLDLRDEHVREAIQAGVQICVNTDAHSVRGLGNMQLAVATARRGWATAADILNTKPLAQVLALRRR
ncbi:MAG TPA: helix-hairpin-helix domain-containing protein [Gaiellaceae bacterium]|nr:helix-hairpin-helix domain-containing protein [Gaiellaceae bacterium]